MDTDFDKTRWAARVTGWLLRLDPTQSVLLAVAAMALGAAAVFYQPLDRQARESEFVVPGHTTAVGSPLQTMMTMAPGGLRAPIVAFLWIRVEDLKDRGRYHEMRDLSDWICHFMPRYPGVWAYHAWNMAWNVSVTAHQEEERWTWVQAGLTLLRDSAIPRNPKSLALYKELGWIFLSKMGQTTDDMHKVYKQRWAERMQHLLAAPPYGLTPAVIEAFRPIAQAPIDKDPYRAREGSYKGNHRRGLAHDGNPQWDADDSAVQPDVRRALLSDNADVARYAALLAGRGVKIDESLLEAYNRFSRDEAVEIVRRRPPVLNVKDAGKTEINVAISALINDPAWSTARNKALAFVRAQVLWNTYRMDPAWMLYMMEHYKVPLDWRTCQAHGLYWITFGSHVCRQSIGKDESLNIDRNLLNCLKDLTWIGRLAYAENPDHPESPDLWWTSDWRYIEPTHQAHINLGKIAVIVEGDVRGWTFDRNKFRTGHINYLARAIHMLYAGSRRERADDYYQWTRTHYKNLADHWNEPLDKFVIEDINSDGRPIPSLAHSQIKAAITAAYEHYAFGDTQRYRASLGYAMRVYRIYEPEAPERLKIGPWHQHVARILAPMLVRPRSIGMYLSLPARHRIYTSLDNKIKLELYDYVGPALRRQCDQAEPRLDFNKAFPAPVGLQEHRRDRAARARQQGRDATRR